METQWVETLFGTQGEPINAGQMTLRAIVIFAFGIFLVRVAGKRAFGRNSAFDIVLAIIIGSNLSRTLTANAPMIPTLAASLALVLMHRALAWAAFGSQVFGALVKGSPRQLVRDGGLDADAMRRSQITRHDLEEAARLHGVNRLDAVQAAYLERSGDISVVTRRE